MPLQIQGFGEQDTPMIARAVSVSPVRSAGSAGKEPPRVIQCIECNAVHRVAPCSTSTICQSCSTYIDLRDIQIKDRTNQRIRTRGNVTVENLIGPRVIEVDVDRRVRRDLPVTFQTAGVAAAGYAWSGEVVTAVRVLRVTGPEKALAGLDSIALAPVRIDGKRDTVRAEVAPVSLPDWCTSEPASIPVKLVLGRRVGVARGILPPAFFPGLQVLRSRDCTP